MDVYGYDSEWVDSEVINGYNRPAYHSGFSAIITENRIKLRYYGEGYIYYGHFGLRKFSNIIGSFIRLHDVTLTRVSSFLFLIKLLSIAVIKYYN